MDVDEYDESKWRAEDDMRTLINAKKIKEDPERYDEAMNMAREKKKELSDLDS